MVFFPEGSDGIQDHAKPVLEGFAHFYSDQRPPGPGETAANCGHLPPGDYRILVVAHANDPGMADQCLLSRRRGWAVRWRLVELGLPEEHLFLDTQGDARSMMPVPAGWSDPQNRRVELWFGGPDRRRDVVSGLRATSCAPPSPR